MLRMIVGSYMNRVEVYFYQIHNLGREGAEIEIHFPWGIDE